MNTRKFTAAIAATGLLLAPMAAHAGTRASDAGVGHSVGQQTGQRGALPVSKDNKINGEDDDTVVYVLIGGVLVAVTIAAGTGNGKTKTDGAT